MQARLEGRVALVTGASRGIGAAIAREMLASGAEGVVMTGRRPETLAAIVADLGPRAVAIAGDVRDSEHAEQAVATAVRTFPAGLPGLRALAADRHRGCRLPKQPVGDRGRGPADERAADLRWQRLAWHAVLTSRSAGGPREAPGDEPSESGDRT